MRRIPKSYQKFLQILIKISIVFGAFYFMYHRIFLNSKMELNILTEQVNLHVLNDFKTVFILLIFTFLNWFFEVLKWKTLVKTIKNISFKEAFIQSLSSHTGALITPNRIGEYGIKALYFDKKNRKKILLLNLIHHLLQMSVTILLGIIGFIYVTQNYYINFPKLHLRKLTFYTTIIFVFFITGKFAIKRKIRSFYWNKIIRFLKQIPNKIVLKGFVFSLIKYIIFSHQFLYLLAVFGVEIEYPKLLYMLFAIYFISSIIPSLPMFDWLIKGSVAIMIFGLTGINEITIILVTSIMWILNFAIPAILGSYYVLKFNKQAYLYKNY